MDKKALRQEIRTRKQAHTPEQLREMSTAIAQTLLVHPKVQAADTILLYASLPDEVDTTFLIEKLIELGKSILLPVVVNDHEMQICRYNHTTKTKISSYGIMEPQDIPFGDYDKIDLAIIPGMAFDRSGNRLGRGKGYYDRFLSQVPALYKIGICFPFQIVDQVPTNENDVRMDEIVIR